MNSSISRRRGDLVLTRQGPSGDRAEAETARARSNLRIRPPGDGDDGYHAFISYSHEADIDFAVLLQAGLEKYAKPWNRFRALRVFRDKSSLSATADLWSAVEAALSRSEWFILIASEEAANSSWVKKEIRWWLSYRSAERLLIVLTSGKVKWVGQEGFDRDSTTAISEDFRTQIKREPLWVDATWARSDSQLTENNPALQETVVSVAAAVWGITKDQLVELGDREFRRTKRVARIARISLAALLVLTITSAAVAFWQRNAAVRQAGIATSGELAALASANLTSNLDLAQLFAVAAYQTDDSPQARAALFQAAAASPHLQRYLQAGAPVSALATSADGTVIAVGTTTGQIVCFDLATGARTAVKAEATPISQVAVSADGSTVVATDGTRAVEWQPRTGDQIQPVASGIKADAVAVSASGRLAALLDASTSARGMVVLKNLGTGREGRAPAPQSFNKLTFTGDSRLMLLNGAGGWEQMSVPALRRLGGRNKVLLNATGDDITGNSPGGAYSGFAKYGSVVAWRSDESKWELSANDLGPVASASSLTISPDGKRAALIVAGAIYVGPLTPYSVPPDNNGATGTELAANGNTSAASFLGGDNRLVSVTGSALALWDLRQVSRVGELIGAVPVEPLAGGPTPPTLAISPDGRELIMPAGITSGFGLFAYRSGGKLVRKGSVSGGGPVTWLGPQPFFVGLGPGNTIRVTNARGEQVRSFPAPGATSIPVAAQYIPQAAQLVMADQSGTIWILDMNTGLARAIRFHNAALQPQSTAISASGWIAEYNQQKGEVFLIALRTGDSHIVGSGSADGVFFARDRLLIQRSIGSLEVWDITGRHLLRTLAGSGGFSDALAVSPDGSLMARLSDNGTASVSSLETGGVLANFSLPVPAEAGYSSDPWLATAMIFSPDGQSILTATAGGQVISWDINPSDLITIACATAGRGLTAAEWQDYIHTMPPASFSCQR
jgi:WD40 repeat protein